MHASRLRMNLPARQKSTTRDESARSCKRVLASKRDRKGSAAREFRPRLTKVRPRLLQIGPVWTRVGPKSGRFGATVARCWLMLAEVDGRGPELAPEMISGISRFRAFCPATRPPERIHVTMVRGSVREDRRALGACFRGAWPWFERLGVEHVLGWTRHGLEKRSTHGPGTFALANLGNRNKPEKGSREGAKTVQMPSASRRGRWRSTFKKTCFLTRF